MAKNNSHKPSIQRHTHFGEDEESRRVLTLVDFSLAFPKTALGTALCITNPIEKHTLDNKCKTFDNLKKKLKLNTLLAQRYFFCKQILQKGLQPTKEKPATPEPEIPINVPGKCFVLTEPNVPAIRFGKAVDNMQAYKQPMYQRSQTLGLPPALAQCANTLGRASPRFGMMSHNKAADDSSSFFGDSSGGGNFVKSNTFQSSPRTFGASDFINVQPASSSFPFASTPRFGGLPANNVVPPLQLSPTDGDEPAVIPKRVRKQKRKLRTLQKDLSLLFPRMDTLIHEGYSVHQKKLPDIPHRRNTRRETVKQGNAKDSEVGAKSETGETLKLVRKIAATLNCDIESKSARQRVLDISNGQQAYVDKEKYLKSSKKSLEKEVMCDRRWNGLESSLSETHGLSLNWKRIRGTTNWVVKT